MNGQDVLAAGLLVALHHEMGVSAGAAPLSFNTLCMGACANDRMSTAVCCRIFDSPNVTASTLHSTMLGSATTLADFPRIEFFSSHKARTLRGPHYHGMLKDVQNRHAQRISSATSDGEMSLSHGTKGKMMPCEGVKTIYGLVPNLVKWLYGKS